MGLTTKRRVFVEEYLTCWNATEAARRAGYKYPRRQGSRLLTFPLVQGEVGRRLTELEVKDRSQIPVRRVRRRSNFVYLIQAENGLVKIGKTANVDSRFKTLNSVSPIELELIDFIETDFADELEDELHACFEHVRVKGEWFRLSEEEIEEIRNRWND